MGKTGVKSLTGGAGKKGKKHDTRGCDKDINKWGANESYSGEGRRAFLKKKTNNISEKQKKSHWGDRKRIGDS